jgi:hypothetical protein
MLQRDVADAPIPTQEGGLDELTPRHERTAPGLGSDDRRVLDATKAPCARTVHGWLCRTRARDWPDPADTTSKPPVLFAWHGGQNQI